MKQIHQCAEDPVGKILIPEQHKCTTTNVLTTCHLTLALPIEHISYVVFRMTLNCRQWNETWLWWWLMSKFIITLSCNVIMSRLIITSGGGHRRHPLIYYSWFKDAAVGALWRHTYRKLYTKKKFQNIHCDNLLFY